MAWATREMKQRIIRHWLNNSVTILDPDTTFIDATVTIGEDTEIYPFTYLGGRSTIGKKCKIGPFAFISDSQIADTKCVEGEKIVADVNEKLLD